jgi:hypothetical protein
MAGNTPKNGVLPAGLEARRARERRDQDAAGLGLPPGVDDRAAVIADHAVVPLPGLGVDRLADRAEQAQALARVFLHPLLALAHQRADRGRGGIEDRHAVAVDDVPAAAGVGIVRHALEHQRGRAARQRAVDHVAVAGHPADVGGAPEQVAVPVVEHVLERVRGIDQVAAARVQHAFGLAGRAGGVEDEQRVLGADRDRRAVRARCRQQLLVVQVAARLPGHLAAGAAHDHDLFDAAGRLLRERRIDVGLQRHLAAAAQALVGGDHELRGAVLDPARQRLRREAAEDDRVDGAEACAGQHRDRRLGDHRQVDRDAVALADAEPLEGVGEAAHVAVQLAVADAAAFLRVVAFPQDRGLFAALGEVPIEAVGRDVELAIAVPANVEVVQVERDVPDLGVGLDPVEAPADLAPEAVGILDAARVVGGVALGIDVRLAREFGGYFVDVAHGDLPQAKRRGRSGATRTHRR